MIEKTPMPAASPEPPLVPTRRAPASTHTRRYHHPPAAKPMPLPAYSRASSAPPPSFPSALPCPLFCLMLRSAPSSPDPPLFPHLPRPLLSASSSPLLAARPPRHLQHLALRQTARNECSSPTPNVGQAGGPSSTASCLPASVPPTPSPLFDRMPQHSGGVLPPFPSTPSTLRLARYSSSTHRRAHGLLLFSPAMLSASDRPA
ncbi:proline-rich receptor-like protein kinase PERK2 [Ananas comosus]|uniref:Proline-rich receptor-like protein kinase PERK2 n=1 Tax=Ananas comosus TaxID=4615 RepID=A0A6P5FPS4_ANACO|nr:proline-rich receptor-like protein kinase PERK2 [Ananas comosus]